MFLAPLGDWFDGGIGLVTVEYHDNLAFVQSDPALGALLSAPSAQAPFDRIDWWQGLASMCNLQPLVAVARDGDACVVLPLCRGDGELAALANWYSFRWRPIVSPGCDPAPLLVALAAALKEKCKRIVLTPLPDEGGEATALEAGFRTAGWSLWREACDTNHVLPVNGRSFDAYLAGRPGHLRTTLKRKAARINCFILECFDEEAWNAWEAIYRDSWKPSEGSPAFLRAFAEAEARAGRMRLGMAFADGMPIAGQLWTVEAGTAFIHKLAHRETARDLSPGTVLSAALFRQVIDRDRVALIDFGTGDDAYKRDWMESQRPRYRLTMLRPGAPANWPLLARRTLARLAAAAKRG